MPENITGENRLGKTCVLNMTNSPGWCGSVVECWPMNQRGAGSIPSQGNMSGLQARSPVGGAQEATHTDVSLPLFPPNPR